MASTLLTGVVAAATCGAGTALAQDASTTAPAPQSANQVAEVVVTAEKRSERLQDVPVSMTAVSSQLLVQQNLVNLADISSRVPGLTYEGPEQGEIAIRGITTGFGTNPTVAVLVDDVPFGSSTAFPQADTLDLDPADINQVEVLRGPQGTLYGASSLGGLIKYTTVEPNTRVYSATAEADAETVNHGGDGYALRATANLPLLQDFAALRLSGFYRTDPSYGYDALVNQNDTEHDHDYGWRAALLLKPLPGMTVDLALLDQHNRSFGESGEVYVDQNYQPLYGSLGYSGLPEYSFDTDRLYTARIAYNLGFATATSLTSYSQYRGNQNQDLTQVFANVVPALAYVGVDVPSSDRVLIGNGHSTNKWTEEFRLQSNAPVYHLDWLAGVFYTHEDSDNPQVLTAVGSGSPINLFTGTGPSTYEEIAGFADLTYHFTPKFDVQVGGRYAHNSQTFGSVQSGPLEVLETGSTTPVTSSGSSSEGATTWLVTPRYHFTHNLMGYVRIATGYRPGGPNQPAPGVPDTFHSDRTTNYEVGLKGEYFQHRLVFDADAYWIDWTDIQLLNADADTGFSYYTNGSSARSRGVEGSAEYKPWRGATFGANLAYTDATLSGAIPQYATASPVYGVSGNRLPYSARFTGNLNAEQDFDLPRDFVVYVGGNLSYVGDRLSDFTDSPDDPRARLPSYKQLDLRAGLRHERYALTLFIKNANDSRGFLSRSYQTNYDPADGYRGTVIQPRTIGLTLSGSF